ncbi:STAS domain-containing protein [Streptomyces sp. V2I9]|uniref:STAS domain-containing protein n=1 Tax=Streptomyces sp. V2I9 TaxID=3042304 RepID=UPI0027810160|nr:STAS domain-containing protein [Streptomyces sp. V2I9]MDQ0982948.1 anti-sigma B factor antagonist [Streptomyces sp. V2I9]
MAGAHHREIDVDHVEPLRLALSAAIRTGSPVVVDCSGIGFADSSFLNTVIVGACSVPIHLAGVPDGLARLFQVTGTTSLFPHHPDIPSALRRCAERA